MDSAPDAMPMSMRPPLIWSAMSVTDWSDEAHWRLTDLKPDTTGNLRAERVVSEWNIELKA